MTNPNWPLLFKHIKHHTRGSPIPYVTRLSQDNKTNSERPFLVLVATIISLRTKDLTTEHASLRLFELADNPKKMAKLTYDQVEKAIYPCGFFRNKAKQIVEISKALLKEFKGKVPNNIDTLIGFPGVGRKTANLVMTEGFGVAGICVDVHVHRILNRLGWIKTKDADETEVVLRDILPKRYWIPINYWLVMFGQFYCKPVKPGCVGCRLKGVCDTGKD